MSAQVGDLHHVEIWVADLESAITTWGWLLTELGYSPYQEWPDGRSWRLNATYIVIERSPALSDQHHDRLRPGLNHVAFHAGTASDVERLATAAQLNGWRLLFSDAHPHAGGDDHYAAYLENAAGFEIELCAAEPTS
jgi:catechol 2,3-dioxygenase-like lactoylglutathione lyase family enzyme